MKILTEINDINIESWQGLLQQSETANWFQSHEAFDFYVTLPNLMTPFVFAVENQMQLKGVCVGYITKEKNPIKQFFTRRAIIIGGPLLAADITSEELTLLLTNVCKALKRKCIYVETRNFNDYSSYKDIFAECGFVYNQHLNFHVDTSSEEIVNLNLHKGRKRDIKLSFRDGATILTNPTLDHVRKYYQLLLQLYTQKVRTPLFPLEFFEQLYKQPSAHFLLIQFNEEIVGGTVCVGLDNNTMYEWFVCGEDGKYKNIFPSELATYAGLQFAAQNGYRRFDMMGAGKPQEHYGVRDFKARFGGQMVQHGRFIHISHPLQYKIGEIGVNRLKSMSCGVWFFR